MKLNVFIGYAGPGFRYRTIIAAPSRAQAASILGLPVSALRQHWSETGNVTHVALATARPLTPLYAPKPGFYDGEVFMPQKPWEKTESEA